MLVTILVILLILWLLGVIGNYTFGGLIHILLVIGLVVLVLSLAERGGRRSAIRLNQNFGLVLAGVWFILNGLLGLIGFSFQGQALVMALLALVAGILLLLGR
jgi:hypothetical protein